LTRAVVYDATHVVTPTDKAVETLGFFGNNGAFMYVVSSDQTVGLYNIEQVRTLCNEPVSELPSFVVEPYRLIGGCVSRTRKSQS
jgi:hypothetical protein